jgi:hypothetical protein
MTRINLVTPLVATASPATPYGAHTGNAEALDYADRYAPVVGPLKIAATLRGKFTGSPMDFQLPLVQTSGLGGDFLRGRSFAARYQQVENEIFFYYYDITVGNLLGVGALTPPAVGEEFVIHVTAEVAGGSGLGWTLRYEGEAPVSGTLVVAPWDAGGFDYVRLLYAGANSGFLFQDARLAVRAAGALPVTQAGYLATDPHWVCKADISPDPEPDVNGQWRSMTVGVYSQWVAP